MLYLCARVSVLVVASAVFFVPTAAAPYQLTPRRDSLPIHDDSPRASDGLIFHRREDLDAVKRHFAFGPDQNGQKAEGMPFRLDDVGVPEASTSTGATLPHSSDAIRPQPSSGTPIFPRMFNLNVNKSKGTKGHATHESTSQYTSAVPTQTPQVDAILWSGSGIALE